MNKHRGVLRKSAMGLGVLSIVVYAGAPVAREVSREAEIRSQIAAANLEDAIVVDCQLPGKLQKLGGMRTYLTPGTLLRLAAVDCRARGGEYTLGDLSGGTLSLQRWMPLAEKGDAEAQYYVARIYANGMGGAPTDYGLAANWYQKAADQSYPSAQQELGYLYERGLGVEKNPMLALNLQRKASGLGEELDYASKVVAAQEQVAALTEQLDASNVELQGMRAQLATTTDALLKSRSSVARSERAVLDLKEQVKVAKAAAGADPAQLKQLQASLTEKEQALTDARSKMDGLTARVREQETELKTQLTASQRSSLELNELLSNEQEKNRSLSARVTQAESRLTRSQQELNDLRVQYRAEVEQMAEQRDEIERATAKTKDAGAALIMTRERELAAQLERQQARVAVLEKALAEALRTQASAATAKTAKSEGDMRKELAVQQTQLEAQRAELTALRAKAQQDRTALVQEMNAQVAKQAADVEAKQRRVATLTAETDALRGEVSRLRQQSEKNLVAGATDVAKAREAERVAQAQVEVMSERLQRAQTDKATQTAELIAARAKLQGQMTSSQKANELQVAFLKKDLELRKKDLETKDSDIANLEQRLAQQTKLMNDMRRGSMVAANTTGGSSVTKMRSIDSSARSSAVDNLIRGLPPGKYRALVIGNSNYKVKSLHLDTPIQDAREVAELLRDKYGFDEVKLMKDATSTDIMLALHEETQTGTDKDSLLIYYAGHGDIAGVPGRAFWLGTDADPATRVGYLEADNIRAKIKDMKAKHVLLVADSCFSGAITTPKTTTIGRGLTETRVKVQWNRKARMVLTSGGLKPVADGVSNDPSHSPFARNFLQALRQNSTTMSGEMLAYDLKVRMESEAIPIGKGEDGKVERQEPTYSMLQDAGHDVGDFFFVPVQSAPARVAGLSD